MVAHTDAQEAVGITLTGSGAVKVATLGLEALALSQRRLDALARKLPDARGVLIAAFPYFAGFRDLPMALYAQGLDYVPHLRDRLSTAVRLLQARWRDSHFAVLPDGSPLPIVPAAQQAGLCLRGRNGLAILPPYGSFFFLGAIVTDRPLPALLPPSPWCSDTCRLCQQACPTTALRDDPIQGVTLDRASCLSHISQKTDVTDAQLALLDKAPTLWGCDICQRVCPYNRKPKHSPYPEFTQALLPDIISDADLAHRACAAKGMAHLRRNAAHGDLSAHLAPPQP